MNTRVFAPAKINLTLQVGRAHANGRHPLQSVVTFADVGDWVEAKPADDLPLSISGPFAAQLSAGEDNLVLRAARALAMAVGNEAPSAALHLEKNLPVASGIGGGSSDAAATLKALNALWKLDLDESALMRMGAWLGGDVPVCVFARGAYMTGEGEKVAPMRLPAIDAVLVNPGRALDTAAVFRTFDEMNLGGAYTDAEAPDWPDIASLVAGIAERGNDLDAAARALAPEIAQISDALRRDARVLHAGLSGSGATMFALTETTEHAAALADELTQAHPEWWVRATRLGAA